MSGEHNGKVYRPQGGDKLIVEDGGEIDILPGGKLRINGIEFPTTIGTAGQVLTVNAGGDGIEWAAIPG